MALMALGIDPRSGTRVDHIAQIVRAFDGRQFGDVNEYNDDVFAIIVLRKAGYPENDSMLNGARDHILSLQGKNGMWSGVDMTAAVIQGLSLIEQTSAVVDAKAKGIEYLRTSQGVDGGFGNSYATSWVIQAILAYGESPAGWLAGGNHPLQALRLYQNEDGGIGEVSEGKASRIWATAYAIPSAHERTWASLLHDYAPPILSSGQSVELYSSTTTSESTTTPIITVGTSTVSVTATTTIFVGDILGAATSTTEEKIRANTGAPRVATSSRRDIGGNERKNAVDGKIQIQSEVVATTSVMQIEEPVENQQINTTKQSLFQRIWRWLSALFR